CRPALPDAHRPLHRIADQRGDRAASAVPRSVVRAVSAVEDLTIWLGVAWACVASSVRGHRSPPALHSCRTQDIRSTVSCGMPVGPYSRRYERGRTVLAHIASTGVVLPDGLPRGSQRVSPWTPGSSGRRREVRRRL